MNKKLVNALATQKHTYIDYESTQEFGCHDYTIRATEDDRVLAHLHFQNGPVLEAGVNGIHNEDLLNIIIHRLDFFQQSRFDCLENQMAIERLTEALMWLRKRTADRELRQVEGTHQV